MKKEKRDILMEIGEGFAALADERAGNITLTRHAVDIKPTPTVTAEEILVLRQRLNLSRAVFARALRTHVRTVENWEPLLNSEWVPIMDRIPPENLMRSGGHGGDQAVRGGLRH